MSKLTGLETSDLAELYATSGTVVSEGTIVRTGDYALKTTGSVSYGVFQGETVANGNYVSYRVYVRISALPGSKQSLLGSNEGTSEWEIYIDTNGDLTIQVTSGSESSSFGTLSAGSYARIDLTLQYRTSGSSVGQAKFNGGLPYGSTGDPIGVVSTVRLYGVGSTDLGYYDDLHSQAHGGFVAYSPDGQIEALRPNLDSGDAGEDDWVPATSYTEVNDDPINDGTEADSNAGANNQLWQQTSLTLGTINSLKIGTRLHDVGGYGGPAYIRSKVSTPENSGDLTADLDTSYAYHEFYPATIPSNQSELDGYQAGAASGHASKDLYCSECWVMVDYQPAALAKRPAGIAVHRPRIEGVISALGR